MNPRVAIRPSTGDGTSSLDEQLAEEGIELIAPHCRNRKVENYTQDGRPLRRYQRRWTVERTLARVQH